MLDLLGGGGGEVVHVDDRLSGECPSSACMIMSTKTRMINNVGARARMYMRPEGP